MSNGVHLQHLELHKHSHGDPSTSSPIFHLSFILLFLHSLKL